MFQSQMASRFCHKIKDETNTHRFFKWCNIISNSLTQYKQMKGEISLFSVIGSQKRISLLDIVMKSIKKTSQSSSLPVILCSLRDKETIFQHYLCYYPRIYYLTRLPLLDTYDHFNIFHNLCREFINVDITPEFYHMHLLNCRSFIVDWHQSSNYLFQNTNNTHQSKQPLEYTGWPIKISINR